MDITVVVCTYNRCDSLALALESILASSVPASIQWEVLVVDNNSKDQTRQIVEEFNRRDSRIRYLFEAQQGLSRARNAGVRAALGAIVAFTDDDVTVDSSWLQTLTASLHSNQWAGAGGPVVSLWTSSPPAWLPRKDRYALAPLAMFEPRLEAGLLDEAPFGANMAFRREMFAKYGDFRVDLGRCGANMMSNEDTEFGGRLLAAGEPMRFEPSAIIRHPVAQSRIKKSYFLAWWFDKARADIRQHGVPQDTKWYIFGVPVYLFRRLLRWWLQWMIGIKPAERFSSKTKVWSVAGSMLECYRQNADRHAHTTPASSGDHVL